MRTKYLSLTFFCKFPCSAPWHSDSGASAFDVSLSLRLMYFTIILLLQWKIPKLWKLLVRIFSFFKVLDCKGTTLPSVRVFRGRSVISLFVDLQWHMSTIQFLVPTKIRVFAANLVDSSKPSELRANGSLLFALDTNACTQTVPKVRIQPAQRDQQTRELTWRHGESRLVTDVLPRRVGRDAAVRAFILLGHLQDLEHPGGEGNEPVAHSREVEIPPSKWVFYVIVLWLPRTPSNISRN